MKRLLILPFFLFAEDIDLDFDIDELQKPYSYKGYVKSSYYKVSNYLKVEGNIEGDYKKNLWYLKGNYSYYIYSNRSDFGVVNEAYVKYGSVNSDITIGKELIKWGKGYAYSAVSFFTRKKDPLHPEDLKEGYEVVHFKMIKSLNTFLKNYAIDLIYMPANSALNSDLPKSQNYGGKVYMLIGDIDVDFMFFKSNELDDKVGADLSFNILPELEFHAEIAKGGGDSFLSGFKYASEYDYTLTTEWYKDYFDNRFIYSKLSKKDFLIDYLTAYSTFFRNYTKNINTLLLGFTYDFKNSVLLNSEFTTSKDKEVKVEIGYYF